MSGTHKLGVIAVNGILRGVFTVICMQSSLLLLVTLSIILAAIGLIFMRRTTERDKDYIDSALKTTLLCAIAYIGAGLYASNRDESGITGIALVLFGFIVLPAYLSMSYMLAVLFAGHPRSQTKYGYRIRYPYLVWRRECDEYQPHHVRILIALAVCPPYAAGSRGGLLHEIITY